MSTCCKSKLMFCVVFSVSPKPSSLEMSSYINIIWQITERVFVIGTSRLWTNIQKCVLVNFSAGTCLSPALWGWDSLARAPLTGRLKLSPASDHTATGQSTHRQRGRQPPGSPPEDVNDPETKKQARKKVLGTSVIIWLAFAQKYVGWYQ